MTRNMANKLRENIVPIVGLCMPLIVAILGVNLTVSLSTQNAVGKLTGKQYGYDNQFNQIRNIDQDQYRRIEGNRDRSRENASDIAALDQRMTRFENRFDRHEKAH